MNLLLKLPQFKKYIQHNMIDESFLLKAVNCMEIDYFPANSYILRQGETSKTFYILIKGKVSIREKKNKTKEDVLLKSQHLLNDASGKKMPFNFMAKRMESAFGSALNQGKNWLS